MSTPVAVLGSGPAGLLAALAVEQAGGDPIIFSKGEKSPMFGAMYLHRPIPAVTNDIMMPDFEIDVIKSGTREGYAYNVYGSKRAPCSWDDIPQGLTSAWDLHAVYDLLWERYSPTIRTLDITPEDLGSILHNYPKTLCTIPAPALCRHGHEFSSKDIWVVHGEGRAMIKGVNDDDIMYYNGVPSEHGGHLWYRFSQIKGYQAWEYSSEPGEWGAAELEWGRHLSVGVKPLKNDCSCWTGWASFYRLGRFGKWEKGVLTHHAYEEAQEAMRAL